MNKLRAFNLLALFYFLLLTIAHFAYYFRENVYICPDIYYYILSIISGLVFTQITISRKNLDNYVKVVLFLEIFLIPLSFITTQQALFKTVLGRDPWFHWVLVEEIVWSGHIPPYSDIPIPYVKMPNFHLLLASGIILLDLPYKWTQVFVAGVPALIILLVVAYLYSSKLFKNEKLALITVLLVAIADNVLDMVGKSIIPNTLGIALTFQIFYLVYFSNFSNIKIEVIAMLMAASLVLTHTISYSLLIWQVIAIVAVALIFRERGSKSLLIFLCYLIILAFFEWSLYTGFYLREALIILKMLFISGFDLGPHGTRPKVSFIDRQLAFLGPNIYLMIAGISLLLIFISLLKEKFRNKLMLSSVLSTGGVVAGQGSFITPALLGITHRFGYYGEVLSSAFISSLLCNINNSRRLRNFVSVTLIIFIISLSFLMFKSNTPNDNNPFLPYYSQRTGWQDSELEAGKFLIVKEGEISFASDFDYSWYLRCLKTNLKSSEVLEDINRTTPGTFDEVKNCSCIFIFRKDMYENRLFYLGSRWNLTAHLPLYENSSSVIDQLSEGGGVIYNNGNVVMILVVGDRL